jgi:hypothetical protein
MPAGANESEMSNELNFAIRNALKAMTKARAAVEDPEVQKALDRAGKALAAACVAAGGGAEYPGA